MYIKFIIIAFAVFALSRAFIRYKNEEIRFREFFIWGVFWLLVVSASLYPKTTDIIAKYLGVERGADLFVYLSIIILYFIVFKVLLHLKKIDREITDVVRKIALQISDKEDNGSHEKKK